MNFLKCKSCYIDYDEGSHKPRSPPCAHEICSCCLRALIKNGSFLCPKCKQKHNINIIDDFPVSSGLVEAIRAFKSMSNKNPSTNEAQARESGATNGEVCKVHHKAIAHQCMTCNIWLCDECLTSHSTYTGCSTISSDKAVENMKEKHNKNIDNLLTSYEEDTNDLLSQIQELTDKRKDLLEKSEKYGEEIKRIRNLLDQGEMQKENLVKSKNHLNATNSPYEVKQRIEVIIQWEKTLCNWSVSNLSTKSRPGLLKALKEDKYVYAEMVIKDEKILAKFSHHEGNIYIHQFQKQTVADGGIIWPFARLQKLIPEEPCLVFLELSIDGRVKGRVLVRLDNTLPNIRECIIQLATNEKGTSFTGITLNYNSYGHIYAINLPFSAIPVTPDSSGRSTAHAADIVGYFGNGYLQHMWLHVGTTTHDYPSGWIVFGQVQAGFAILQELCNNRSDGLKISDCGLVIEQE